MKKHKISKYNPEYPYLKEDITIDSSHSPWPVTEARTNALLFPEGIKPAVEFREFKEGH